MGGGSASASPCSSSYQPSPNASSYNFSPTSSLISSPGSTIYASDKNPDPNSLIPWLKNLSSGSTSSKFPHHLYIASGSVSAPVTPPISSPTCQTPRMTDIDDQPRSSLWPGPNFHIPGIQTPPDSGWLSGVQTPQEGPASPTFSLVASNHPFGFKEAFSGRMWTPGQSGTCSPAVNGGVEQTADVPMSDVISSEFAFGSNMKGLVKPWEGERIHEECVSDDLELTLGNPSTR